MAGSLSNFLELEILDQLFGGASYTFPATLYFGLSTADPTEDASGNAEPGGGSYARKSVTANQTNFPAASSGSIDNGVAIEFATATASWGTITHGTIWDAATVGNMLAHWDLTASKTVDNGDTVSYAIGAFVCTLT
jgi:hypothetical protein